MNGFQGIIFQSFESKKKQAMTRANLGLFGPICGPQFDVLMVDLAGRIWRSSKGGEYVSRSTLFLTSSKQ